MFNVQAREACDDSTGVQACADAFDYCVKHVSVPPAELLWRDNPELAKQAAEYPELVQLQQKKLMAKELCALCLPTFALCLEEENCTGSNSSTFARYADQCVNISQCASCLYVPEDKPQIPSHSDFVHSKLFIIISSTVCATLILLFIVSFFV